MFDLHQKRHGQSSLLQTYGEQLGHIMERKLTEQALIAAKQEAERTADAARVAFSNAETANLAKTKFLATMSHELRTPLNAIIGFSEMIQEELLGRGAGDRRYLDYAGDIRKSGMQLLGVINDILDIAKIESGQLYLEQGEFAVGESMNSCLEMLADQAQKGDVRLERKGSDPAPKLWGDEKKFKQIVINLLSNGIKFTPEGGKVGLQAEIESDGGLKLTISDTGIGIAAEDFAAVMAPFAQVDSAYCRKHEGTGLGLPISKALAELHGGSLTMESEPGVGTTVVVRFPAERLRWPTV